MTLPIHYFNLWFSWQCCDTLPGDCDTTCALCQNDLSLLYAAVVSLNDGLSTPVLKLLSFLADFVPQIVKVGIDKLFEVTREKDQNALITVLVALQVKGALSADQLLTGIRKSTDQLEDLRSGFIYVQLHQLVHWPSTKMTS